MPNLKIEQIAREIAEPIAKLLGCYIYDVEYTREGGDFFLRIFADKENGPLSDGLLSDGRISLDECEAISREVSRVLDEQDPIERNYYLEVSSPGITRKLKTREHFDRYTGALVDVTFYKALNGSKRLTGKLSGLAGGVVRIEVGGEFVEFPKDAASKINLHVKF